MNDKNVDLELSNKPEIDLDQKEAGNALQTLGNQVSSFNDTVIASTAEIKEQLIETTTSIKDSIELFQDCNTTVKNTITELHKEVVILRDVSKRIQEFIHEEIQIMLPSLTQNIDNIYQAKLAALDHNIEANKVSIERFATEAKERIMQLEATCKSAVDQLNISCTQTIERIRNLSGQSIDNLIAKSKQLGNSYLRQLGITIGVTTIITIIVSSLSSYFIVQRMPTRVVMNADKDINIINSDVKILKHPIRRK